MSTPSVNYRIQHEFASRGYDRKTCWVHPRAGIVAASPDENPTVVLTMNKLLLSGSDVFYALNSTRSADLGKTWTPPQEQDAFHRVRVLDENEARGAGENLIEKIVCDFTPQWHAPSSTLLGIGHTAYYCDNEIMQARPRQTAYSVYDAGAHCWKPWSTLQMPDGAKFYNAGSGSTQWVDVGDNEILLPMYFQVDDHRYASIVVRCRFDGAKLEYLQHGNELFHSSGRGLYEPSLTQFNGRFYLTLRNDFCGYVASSDDGLHFDEPRVWRFDDSEELGNYNTQQHWVKHSGALFLVYTRRGLHNDHVFRHRAPLVMSQVDLATLRVLRATERVIVPERGARLGNFGVTQVNENETWITVAEWMQTRAPHSTDSTRCERYGSDNTVWIARLIWDEPNVPAAEL